MNERPATVDDYDWEALASQWSRHNPQALWRLHSDAVNRALLLGTQPLPPGRERIDEEVAGFGGTAEGHRKLGGIFIEDPTRNIVFRTPKVMVTRLVLTARFPSAREWPKLDCGFTVHAQSRDPWGVLARLVFF